MNDECMGICLNKFNWVWELKWWFIELYFRELLKYLL